MAGENRQRIHRRNKIAPLCIGTRNMALQKAEFRAVVLDNHGYVRSDQSRGAKGHQRSQWVRNHQLPHHGDTLLFVGPGNIHWEPRSYPKLTREQAIRSSRPIAPASGLPSFPLDLASLNELQ